MIHISQVVNCKNLIKNFIEMEKDSLKLLLKKYLKDSIINYFPNYDYLIFPSVFTKKNIRIIQDKTE